MLRLIRIVSGLLLIFIVCVAFAIVSHDADTSWDCIRYETFPRSSLLDVGSTQHFVEASYAPSLSYSMFKWPPNTHRLIYSIAGGDMTRVGVIDRGRVLNYIDGKNSLDSQVFTPLDDIAGISPDDKYGIFATLDQSQYSYTLVIRDLESLAPIVTTTLNYDEQTDFSRLYFAGQWSPTAQRFSFTNTVSNKTTLVVMDIAQRQTQTVPLPSSSFQYSRWSPTETSIAVVSRDNNDHIDLVSLVNGRWQLVYSADLNSQEYDNIHHRVLYVEWTSDGQAMEVTLMSDYSSQAALQFALTMISTTNPRLSVPVKNSLRPPDVLLGGTWACAATPRSGENSLIPLVPTSTQSPLRLATSCGSILQDYTGKAILAKLGQADGVWTLIKAAPFRLTPLSLSPKFALILWSYDGQTVLYFDRVTMTHGLLNINTGEQHKLPQPANTKFSRFSSDSTRFTVLSDDWHHLWLYDRQGNLLAALPLRHLDNLDFTLIWSPDSDKFFVTDFNSDGDVLIYNRDGQQLASFSKQSFSRNRWIIDQPNQGWSTCDPSPKIPRMNLPQ